MLPNTIITISRQYGSQGHEIGVELANRLGIPFYDRSIIAMASKESGFSEKLFDSLDKRSTSSLLYSLATFGSVGMNGLSLSDQLYVVQRDVIRKLASDGSCVIIGRAASHVLRDWPEVYNVFISAPIEKRMEHAATDPAVKKVTKDAVERMDKQRASFYNYYSGRRWGEAQNYDLCLNTGRLPVEKCVDAIIEYIETVQALGTETTKIPGDEE